MEKKINGYFDLLLESGVNIKKGQKLLVNADIEISQYVRIIVDKAYDLGAKKVIVSWSDSKISRTTFLKAEDSVFDESESWYKSLYDSLSNEGACFLNLISKDPENLINVDANRIIRNSITMNSCMKEYRNKTMSNQVRWCVAGIPGRAWAKKVFPNEKSYEDSINRLWESILFSAHVSENNTIENWKNHTNKLYNRCKILNDFQLKSIHLKNDIGTDLVVELPYRHIWAGGEEKDINAIPFSANIPTEEIFTAPKKYGVNGTVKNSKPFVYNGNIIDDFMIWFENGRAVKVKATKNQNLLEKLISVEENSSYLGEIALVPYNSPISLSNTLFYNTLYDENASCHLAFGKAYPNSIENSTGKSEEELEKMGINNSNIHEDFMIGTSDLYIKGKDQNDNEMDIFLDGDFCF